MSEVVIYCVECKDVMANVLCNDCKDYFCSLCFQWLHKKGKRKEHKTENLQSSIVKNIIAVSQQRDEIILEGEGTTNHFVKSYEQEYEERKQQHQPDAKEINHLLERIKYIPLRLNDLERKLLRLIEGALEISEYTDKVDVSNNNYGFGFMFYSSAVAPSRNKEDTIRRELDEIFSLIMGLFTSDNFKAGSKLIEEKKFEDNEEFFQKVFEIGRRFKIMNPDKLRGVYGKLMCVLQDSVIPDMINFSCYRKIKSVHTFLEEKEAMSLIHDDYDLLLDATADIDPSADVQHQSMKKNAAKQTLLNKYSSIPSSLSSDDISWIISSISDSNSFVQSNRTPIDMMIHYLETYFDPKDESKGSLEIRSGAGGSCLSHSHSTQYKFVMQSLLLWREIQHEMYKLWVMTDKDLLNESNRYRLYNTGQGLQRVQAAPCVGRTMSSILGKVQSQMGGWVGLSVVHLGDRDVPNALVFIDKYTQVPWILSPIVQTIQNIGDLSAKDNNVKELIETQYGGVEVARKVILRDFFRHGFDGSGDDGGSCIDGRLTSAWNWCSLLEKKEFYNLFMVCGFEGFNGSYRR